jgi:hypothetical protein
MPRRLPPSAIRQLAADLTGLDAVAAGEGTHGFSAELAAWLAAAPRFAAFTDTHRDKIRKKLRSARDAGALLDVRAELLVAHRLLPADSSSVDVAGAVRTLRARADAKDEAFFTRRRFASTRDFYDRFLRLGAVVTWPETGTADAWMNGSARIPVPDRALRACLSALSG